jgi:hypothetical protein
LHKYGVTAVDVIKGTESRNGDWDELMVQ